MNGFLEDGYYVVKMKYRGVYYEWEGVAEDEEDAFDKAKEVISEELNLIYYRGFEQHRVTRLKITHKKAPTYAALNFWKGVAAVSMVVSIAIYLFEMIRESIYG
ncbi:hypothetical protein [Enterococcus phage vB_EfaS_Ef2.2]|nr:hypothetical protein [Enterococcus phage vB_EfaS_Ef2.2]